MLRKLLLEFCGSFGYLLLGASIELLVLHYIDFSEITFAVLIIALGFSISFFIFYSFCNLFSDVWMHPLFTFSAWLKNYISFYQMVFNIFIQIIGASTAGIMLSLLFPNFSDALIIGVTSSSSFPTSFNTIILIEFLVSFLFTFTYYILEDNISSKIIRRLMLAIALLLLLFIDISYTGSNVNPIRGFLSNLFVNFDTLCQLNFYVVPAFAGTLFSTILYHFFTYRHNSVL